MKRIVVFSALFLLLLPSLSAEPVPTQYYEPAHIGLYLPDDTEIEEEDGVWYAFSETAEMWVSFEPCETYIPTKKINESLINEYFADYDIENFTFLSVMVCGKVTYGYGQGIVYDEDGEPVEGFFGLLTNNDVPNRTFLFSVVAPTFMVQNSGEAAQTLLENIPSAAEY